MFLGPCTSRLLTATGVVKNLPGTLWGLVLVSNGTQHGTASVRDGLDANAPEVLRLSVPATAGASAVASFPHGVALGTGIFVVLTNAAAVSVVFS